MGFFFVFVFCVNTLLHRGPLRSDIFRVVRMQDWLLYLHISSLLLLGQSTHTRMCMAPSTHVAPEEPRLWLANLTNPLTRSCYWNAMQPSHRFAPLDES